jgi:hypothetical protein
MGKNWAALMSKRYANDFLLRFKRWVNEETRQKFA